jgi:hypothetical protein
MLHVALQVWFIDLTANEAFGIEDRVGWVGVERILGGITDSGAELTRRLSGARHEKNTYSRSSSLKATQEGVIR